jgi:hypothetical protein
MQHQNSTREASAVCESGNMTGIHIRAFSSFAGCLQVSANLQNRVIGKSKAWLHELYSHAAQATPSRQMGNLQESGVDQGVHACHLSPVLYLVLVSYLLPVEINQPAPFLTSCLCCSSTASNAGPGGWLSLKLFCTSG